jgi:hypothetical protein
MPYCASCGVHCSDSEAVEDTRGDTEVTGSVAWSRVERVYYCRECATSHAKTSRLLMWVFGLFGVIVMGCAGFEVYKWLFGGNR